MPQLSGNEPILGLNIDHHSRKIDPKNTYLVVPTLVKTRR